MQVVLLVDLRLVLEGSEVWRPKRNPEWQRRIVCSAERMVATRQQLTAHRVYQTARNNDRKGLVVAANATQVAGSRPKWGARHTTTDSRASRLSEAERGRGTDEEGRQAGAGGRGGARAWNGCRLLRLPVDPHMMRWQTEIGVTRWSRGRQRPLFKRRFGNGDRDRGW